jgi:hypothetical protein
LSSSSATKKLERRDKMDSKLAVGAARRSDDQHAFLQGSTNRKMSRKLWSRKRSERNEDEDERRTYP